MTHSDTSRTSNAALHKIHSITSPARVTYLSSCPNSLNMTGFDRAFPIVNCTG
jgi:hypothetical protein